MPATCRSIRSHEQGPDRSNRPAQVNNWRRVGRARQRRTCHPRWSVTMIALIRHLVLSGLSPTRHFRPVSGPGTTLSNSYHARDGSWAQLEIVSMWAVRSVPVQPPTDICKRRRITETAVTARSPEPGTKSTSCDVVTSDGAASDVREGEPRPK